MKLLITVLLICSSWSISNAQTPTFDWATQIGNGGSVYASSMIVDNSGNIYQIGQFSGGTSDFDPGMDSLHLTPAGSNDIFISKLDFNGDFLWAKRFGGIDNDEGASIAVDGIGSVYFTGYFNDLADFDPGSGVFNLTSQGGDDIFVCKLDFNGDFLWAKQFGSTSSEGANGIVVDSSGAYITGHFSGTVDFDPGTGTTNLTSNGLRDIFLCKLNSSGVFQWAEHFGSNDNDYGNSITLDNSSNIFLTGSFQETVDFDPGTGVFNLTAPATSSNSFILKLTATGSFDWATQLALPSGGSGNAITLDGSGNVYVGGGGPGITLSKLDATGSILWSQLLSGSNANAHSIVVDVSGNVYAAGSFSNSVDFDPSTNSAILTSAGGFDAFLTKFDASGNYVWAYEFGDSFQDYGATVALDASSNIYSFGHFRNTTDFDPGSGIYNLTSLFVYDVYLLKWIQTPVGIEESTGNVDVTITPNPTQGTVNIDLSELQGTSVKVYSAGGKLTHHRENIKDTFYQFELNGPAGIYFVEVNSQNKLMRFKIIKN